MAAGVECVMPTRNQRAPEGAMHMNVGDGFKFGCGMILAGLAFSFSLAILATVALLVSTLLNLPLPTLLPRG